MMLNTNPPLQTLSLSDEQSCVLCDSDIGDVRYTLSEQIQKIDFSNSSLPCIDIAYGAHIGFYCSDDHAIEAAEKKFQSTGTELSWPDIVPIVQCSICNADFRTDRWHTVMTLTTERGDLDDPEVLDAEDLARVCTSCAPLDANPTYPETDLLFFGPAALVNTQDEVVGDAAVAQ